MDTLVLFLILGECLQFFTIEECLLWVYHIWLLLSWAKFLLCLLSGVFFFLIINGCWILSKAFSASIEIIIWFLFFSLLMCITLIDFADIEESLHPWDKALLIMMYELFHMLFDSVCYNFVKDFCIYIHQWYWPVVLCFFFFVASLSGFGLRVMVAP